MADVRRTLSALQTLLADNTARDISAQDARDALVSEHPENSCQTAVYASEPASGQLTGDLFLPSDSLCVERWSGSAWNPWGPIWQLTKPVDGDFSWTNKGSAEVTATKGIIFMTVPAIDSDNHRIRKKAAPAVPFTLTAAFIPMFRDSAYPRISLGFREATSGKLSCIHWALTDGGFRPNWIAVDNLTNETTFSAQPVSHATNFSGGLVWLRINDDGTSRKFSFSMDGINFHEVYSVARATFLTAWATEAERQVYWSGNAYDSVNGVSVSLISWKES